MTTSTTSTILTGQALQKTVDTLQGDLLALVHLSLLLKQVHWNVRGPHFRSVHLQLDEIVADVRDGYDEVAERIVTLGAPADGRAETIAADAVLESVPAGFISDTDALVLVCARLLTVIQRLRESISLTDKGDPVTQDLLIGVSQKLEKHMWMVRSQTE